jgi:Fe-S oxidoreductase
MAGTYGHETRNQQTSRAIFEQSWGPLVDAQQQGDELLATGYSCRSQVDRLRARRMRHPLEVLLAVLAARST